MVVLFDLDGTLVDTWDLYIEAYLRALAPTLGRRPSFEELVALKPVSELRLLRNALGEDAAADGHRRFIEHYRALHDSHFGGVYPDVPATLEALRHAGHRLGIVTGKSEAAWHVTRRVADLGPFDVVVTDEVVTAPKPDPAGLELALKRLGASPADAVYVGDGVGDAGAAKAAKMGFAAALWPKGPHERGRFVAEVQALGARVALEKPTDLVTVLEQWQSPVG